MTDAWECPKCKKDHGQLYEDYISNSHQEPDPEHVFHINCDCGTKLDVEWVDDRDDEGWDQTVTFYIDKNQEELNL